MGQAVSHLCPGLVSDTFLLNKIALDSLSSIVFGEFPDQPHGGPSDVSDLQVPWRSGDVCTVTKIQSETPTQNRLGFVVQRFRDEFRTDRGQ